MELEKKKMRGMMTGPGGRKHPPSKIERAGAGEAVGEVLMGGTTLEEACGKFREIAGEPLSINSMSRYRKRLFEHTAKMEKLDILVDRLLDRASEAPSSDPSAMVREMMLALAIEAADTIIPEAMAAMPPGELSLLVARLERTRSARDRVRLGYIQAAMAAKRGILREMAEEVAHNPMQLQEMRRVSREEDEQIAEEEEEAAKGGGQSPGR
jgi:hypothetical protein